VYVMRTVEFFSSVTHVKETLHAFYTT